MILNNFEPFFLIYQYYIFLATQDLIIIPPEDTVTLAQNEMTNATFNCVTECTHGASACGQPFWSLYIVNERRIIATPDIHDEVKFAQRGITYSSAATSAVISIPDRADGHNLQQCCYISSHQHS